MAFADPDLEVEDGVGAADLRVDKLGEVAAPAPIDLLLLGVTVAKRVG